MKMPSVALGMTTAMAMMVVSGSFLHGAAAQESVSCNKVIGEDASVSDANTMVQELRRSTAECCPTAGYCNYMAKSGNAQAISCDLPCMSCAAVGNGLNKVLAQCVDSNGVQGLYSPNGAYGGTILLTAASTTFP